jgi:hypothetical protein
MQDHASWCIEDARPISTDPTTIVMIFFARAETKFPIMLIILPRMRRFLLPKMSPKRPTNGEVIETVA